MKIVECSYQSAWLIYSLLSITSVLATTGASAQTLEPIPAQIENAEPYNFQHNSTSQSETEPLRQVDAKAPILLANSVPQTTAGRGSNSTNNSQADRKSGISDWPQFSGDFRLRYEDNSPDGATPSWNRGVLRGRIASNYHLSDAIKIGGRMVTGDSGNPRTSDTTIGGFDSDLEISLDQAYVSYQNQSLFLTGGKFAKPFSSTELVWDGDVNPQGLGAHYDFAQGSSWSTRLSAVYFLINEDIFAGDSDMLGTQLSASLRPHDDWSVAIHTAYFDYKLGTLGPGVAGLARGNNIAPGGATLLSDFELLDIMSSVTWSGLGDRWPFKLVGDYVHNLGAAVPEDSGYSVDFYAGNLSRRGGLQFRYGYSEAETDAVLGMFSNDNIVYPTNYRLHTFCVDYALRENTFIGLTNYRYRHLVADPASSFENDWVSRTRLNLYFNF